MNEKVIWDCLLAKIGNEFGVAAIMGNLMAESSLNPRNATNLKKTGYTTVDQYILATDDGVHDFAHDGVAFGLVQWFYWSRKQGLLDYAKSTGRSIGHLQMQLEYILVEMSNYKTAWNAVHNAKDIRTASDIVMLKYENPGTQTEAAKQKRAAYGQKFYDQFAKAKPEPKPEPVPAVKTVVATANVRIRAGDGTEYGQVGSLKNGESREWVATSNGFHAIRMKDRVGWVSGKFSEVKG